MIRWWNMITNRRNEFIGVAHIEDLADAEDALTELYEIIWILAQKDPNRIQFAAELVRSGFTMSPGHDIRSSPTEPFDVRSDRASE